MIRTAAIILAFSSLAACGAGGSEFAVKSTAACVKEQGQQAAAKCACEVRIAEQALSDKEKKFIVSTMDLPEGSSPEVAMKALSDSGITIQDMMSMAGRMQEVEQRSEAECK